MLDSLRRLIADAAGGTDFKLNEPEFERLGHFTTNAAFAVAKRDGVKPVEAAERLKEKILSSSPGGLIDRIDVVPPGFLNLWLTKRAIQDALGEIAADASYGLGDGMKGKTVMVEFTDPNPFKLFHIGHLMSNTIGESFARTYEAVGAKVIRANYQGDVGLHIAMSIWAMKKVMPELPNESASIPVKMEYLGKAYAAGSKAYRSESDPNQAKAEIEGVNALIYSRSDPEINRLYDLGRKWSLDYFELIYKRLGTKFDQYFFESEVGEDGLKIVLTHKDIFKESQGAVVFPGEEYGLHTRVFINSLGLPTYEAKELGLNKKKFELYPLDLSVIVTGNEIIDYFRVLMKAMEFVIPEVAARTRHVPHGMLRLPSGKMSSRTGDVITADSLLEQIKSKLREHVSEGSDLSPEERENADEKIAVGAIKYCILKQSPGQDIIFDFDKSLSFEGDAGPYLQYAYARAMSILKKADNAGTPDFKFLESEEELALIRKLTLFPGVILSCATELASNGLASYLYDLARTLNRFYEARQVLKAAPGIRESRLGLVEETAKVLKTGLNLLGIETLERM